MIRSFADDATRAVRDRVPMRRVPPDLCRAMLRNLRFLDAATRLEDLRSPPGNGLEKLRGDREGQRSIRVNDQWRICFNWSGNDAYNVEIVDCHQDPA